MKFKSLVKIGLPILAVTGLAVSIPLAITSCGNNKSKTETNKVVSTSQKDVTNAIDNLGKLNVEPLGGKTDAIKDQTVFDSLKSSLKLSEKEILNVNYSKNATSSESGVAKLTSQKENKKESESEEAKPSTSNTWTIQVTLKDNYSWSEQIIKATKSTKDNNVEIQGKTLTIKSVETKFATIGINKDKLTKNSQKFVEALNEIKDLANYAPQVANGKQTQVDTETKQEKLFIANFVEKVPSIPLTALVAQLSAHANVGNSAGGTSTGTGTGSGESSTSSDSSIGKNNGKGDNGKEQVGPKTYDSKVEAKDDKKKEVTSLSKESKTPEKKTVEKKDDQKQEPELTLSKNKVDAKISAGKDYVIFEDSKSTTKDKKDQQSEQQPITYTQEIDYNYVDIDSLASKITDFVNNPDIQLNKSGKTIELNVKDDAKTLKLPVKYDVMNPFSQQTKLGMTGTYALNFSLDFSKFGFKDSKLATSVQSSLSSIFGSNATYPTENKAISVSFDETTNHLNIQVMSNVFAVTKNSLINGVSYLKHFTKDQLSNVQGEQKDKQENEVMNTNIRIGLLESMGFYELISPMANSMKVSSVAQTGQANQTTLKIEFGIGQNDAKLSGTKMATLSKELQSEITKNPSLGLKGVQFKFEEAKSATTTTEKDGIQQQESTPASLSITIDNSQLSTKSNLSMSSEQKMKDLGVWLETINADTIKPSEFIKQTGMGSGAANQIVGLALDNSSIIKTVTSKLGVSKNDIYQVRLVTTKSKDSNQSLQFLVILNSGLTFGKQKDQIINVPTSKATKLNVTGKITKTFSYGIDNNDTLMFTISENDSSSTNK